MHIFFKIVYCRNTELTEPPKVPIYIFVHYISNKFKFNLNNLIHKNVTTISLKLMPQT